MSTISVLMSIYYKEDPVYLKKALRSIWHDQLRKPDQVILVLDGPLTNAHMNVIQEFSRDLPDKLTILKNNENIGLTKSLNRGIRHVTCDYIARMDSDDISVPERFKVQEEYMDAHPDICILGGSIEEFNDVQGVLGIRTYPRTDADILKYIYKGSPLAHPTVMIRKSLVFDKGLRYNEKYKTSQDIALWYDCVCNGIRISNLKEIMLHFRRDDQLTVRRGHEKARNERQIYMDGIRRLYGPYNWRTIYPIARYIFRMMPRSVIKSFYSTRLRQFFFHGSKK